MKKILFLISVLLFAAGDSFAQHKPLANENKSGLYARSIEQVLRMEPEEVDLGVAALIISEQWSDLVPGRKHLSQLDDMAYEIRSRFEKQKIKSVYKKIEVINQYLFDELGFEPVQEADDPNDLFLHTVLDKRRGYCLSLSILYLAIGERLGLELYGVVVPRHFFVRYDNGRIRFNIETTSKGGYADDEHYIEKFKVPQSGSDGMYMKNLNKIETLGAFFNNLGLSYSAIGNSEQALLALQRASQITPTLAECRSNLGNIYLAKGRIQDAIYEYRTALKINPNDGQLHHNLGNAYFKREWFGDAISEYTKAIRLDPDFIDAYKNLARVYSKRQMHQTAVRWLREAIAKKSDDAGLYAQLGDTYSSMDNCAEAVFQYEKAIRIQQELAEAYIGLAGCYGKEGLKDDEIATYKKALAVKPDSVSVLVSFGNAYFARKDYDAAIEQYKKALALEPDNGSVYYNLGSAYLNKSQYQKTVSAASKALEVAPEMGEAHHLLAYAYYNLKKFDLAWEHIEAAESMGMEVSEELRAAIEERL